ncbi:unnamed protein product, partial [Chrysoparadoxa australica]
MSIDGDIGRKLNGRQEQRLLAPPPTRKPGGVILSKAPLHCAPELHVSLDQLTVSADERGYRMLRASHGVDQGQWYWEAEMLRTDSSQEGHCRIGWASNLAALQAPCGYDKHSYAYRNLGGSKVHESKRYDSYGEAWGPGDVVGFYISLAKPGLDADPKENRIHFVKNGVDQGEAYSGVLPALYHPAVSVSNKAQVRANFGPDFIYPPPPHLKGKPISELKPLERKDLEEHNSWHRMKRMEKGLPVRDEEAERREQEARWLAEVEESTRKEAERIRMEEEKAKQAATEAAIFKEKKKQAAAEAKRLKEEERKRALEEQWERAKREGIRLKQVEEARKAAEEAARLKEEKKLAKEEQRKAARREKAEAEKEMKRKDKEEKEKGQDQDRTGVEVKVDADAAAEGAKGEAEQAAVSRSSEAAVSSESSDDEKKEDDEDEDVEELPLKALVRKGASKSRNRPRNSMKGGNAEGREAAVTTDADEERGTES